MYSLLCQYANIGPTAAVHASGMKSDMSLTNFSKYNFNRKRRVLQFLEGSRKAQRILLVLVILGAAFVFGDGVLTPAISGAQIHCSL